MVMLVTVGTNSGIIAYRDKAEWRLTYEACFRLLAIQNGSGATFL